MQNLLSSRWSDSQHGQRMVAPSCTAVRAAGSRVARRPVARPGDARGRWCVSTPELARCQAKNMRRLEMLEWRWRAEEAGVVTGTVVVGGYRARPEFLAAIIRIAKSAKLLRSRACGRMRR